MSTFQSLVIEIFDLFSFGFTFTINKRYRISTLLGAIWSFIIFVIFIILFFLIGENFLYSKNPITSTSSFERMNYTKVNLTEDYSTIVISFTRRESNSGYPPLVNITGDFLYGFLSYVNGTYSEKKQATNVMGQIIPIVECSQDFLNKYNFIGGYYYCLNLSMFPVLFGDENQQNYNIYRFIIAGCQKNKAYSKKIGCIYTDELDAYFKTYKTTSYFKIYFPTHFYDPNEHAHPSKIVYKQTTFPFDHNLQRTDYLYFRETIVENDDGWLFSNSKNTSYWTVEERDYHYQYKTNEIIESSTSSSLLYTMMIYQSKNVIYHTRSYMKLTELLSYIFCYIRIIVAVVAFCFSFFVNPLVLKFQLMNLFFGEGTTKTPEQDLIRSINFITAKPTMLHTSSMQKINESQNSQSINVINQSVLQKKNINMENSGLALNGTLMNHQQKKKEKKNNIKISKTGYICFKYKSVFNRKIEKENLKYSLSDSIVSENYDLKRYTQMIYDIQIMKQCLYPPECLYCVNNHKKYNINNFEESEKLFGMKTVHYQDSIKMAENLCKLKTNYPNLVKDKDYFVSIAQD